MGSSVREDMGDVLEICPNAHGLASDMCHSLDS